MLIRFNMDSMCMESLLHSSLAVRQYPANSSVCGHQLSTRYWWNDGYWLCMFVIASSYTSHEVQYTSFSNSWSITQWSNVTFIVWLKVAVMPKHCTMQFANIANLYLKYTIFLQQLLTNYTYEHIQQRQLQFTTIGWTTCPLSCISETLAVTDTIHKVSLKLLIVMVNHRQQQTARAGMSLRKPWWTVVLELDAGRWSEASWWRATNTSRKELDVLICHIYCTIC